MRIGPYEFNMRELAGSMGDFGTLLPLAIGYLTVCRMNPTGILVMMGLANIITGLIYRLPIPIEPMKVIAIMAIAQVWSPEKVYTAAFVTGCFWLLMAVTGAMTYIARWTPKTVVVGIQLSLGALLAIQGVKMISSWWLLGLIALVIVFTLRKNRYAPAAVVLVLLGIIIIIVKGQLSLTGGLGFSLPPLTIFRSGLVWPALRDGCLAQFSLTATNAVIATVVLISKYWPERRVTERQLSLNMGIMNLTLPFFGGMPLCHGAGGLAGQYYFGARTGGANIIEGIIEIFLGVFLAGTIAAVFAAFPLAIVGAMMFLVGLELAKFGRDLKLNKKLIPVLITIAGSLIFNMAVGYVAGMIFHYIMLGKIDKKIDLQVQ